MSSLTVYYKKTKMPVAPKLSVGRFPTGLDDTVSTTKEQHIFVTSYDQAAYNTKNDGLQQIICEFIGTSNETKDRSERLRYKKGMNSFISQSLSI